nr:macro domain-containing protein [Luteolibacter marinus]
MLDQSVEVIVNAWNRNMIPWWLLLPQGVSGAIKRKAGYAPFRELAKMGPIGAGEARLTTAGRLPFCGIIHVAGINLFWRSSAQIIAKCVHSALSIASEQGFRSIAFPLIGSGTGGIEPSSAREWMIDAVDASDFEGEVLIVEFSPTKAECH